jgi:hypothetical protein
MPRRKASPVWNTKSPSRLKPSTDAADGSMPAYACGCPYDRANREVVIESHPEHCGEVAWVIVDEKTREWVAVCTWWPIRAGGPPSRQPLRLLRHKACSVKAAP